MRGRLSELLSEAGAHGGGPGAGPAVRVVAQVGNGLLRMPPDWAVAAADAPALAALVAGEPEPGPRLGARLLGVLVAWHLDDEAGLATLADAWLRDASGVAAALPPGPASLAPATGLAQEVHLVVGVLGQLGGAAERAAGVLLVAARHHGAAGAEEQAGSLASSAAEVRQAAGVAVDGDGSIRARAEALEAAVVGGRVRDQRSAMATLLRLWELLGDTVRAQQVRLPLLDLLVAGTLIPQATALLDQSLEPVVVPDQVERVTWARAQLLVAAGQVAEGYALAATLRDGLPVPELRRAVIGQFLARQHADAREWAAARAEFAPLVAHMLATVAAGVAVPEPDASAIVDILMRDAYCAFRLGDVVAVSQRRAQISVHLPTTPLAGVNLQLVDGWLVELTGDLGRAEQAMAQARDTLEAWQRSTPERISGLTPAIRSREVEGALVDFAARRADAPAVLAYAERDRADLLRAGLALERDPVRAGGFAAFLDVAARRLAPTPGEDPAYGVARGGARRLAAQVISSVQDEFSRSIVLTPVQPWGDAWAATRALLDAAGPAWLVVSLGGTADVMVVTSTDGVGVHTERLPVATAGLDRLVADVFTRATGTGPRPGDPGWVARAEACLATLDPLVGDPIRRAMTATGRTRVLLSVPGWMTCVPFAALGVGERRLVDELSALTVVSGLVLAAESLVRHAPGPMTPVRDGVLVGAVTDQSIPMARAEGALVARRWATTGRRVTAMLPVDQGGLVEAMPRSAVAHLASHASWSLTRAADGGLRLGDDLVDTGELLVALDVRGAPLVVLSGCDTAASDLFPGGGEAVNLAAMVTMAGAREVVASLWPARDQSSLVTMVRFHELVGEGLDPAEAVVTAARHTRSLTYAVGAALATDWATELRTPGWLGAEAEAQAEAAAGELDLLAFAWSHRPPDGRPFAGLESWAVTACLGAPGVGLRG